MEEPWIVFFFTLIRSEDRRELEELAAAKIGGQKDDPVIKTAREYLQDKYGTSSTFRFETIVLTEPTKMNGCRSVCMYCCGCGDVNKRATDLLLATGRGLPEDQKEGIRGDVFIGRHHEDSKTWIRVDLRPQDAEPSAAWVQLASEPGGGGGSFEASSISEASAPSGQAKSSASGKVKSSRAAAAKEPRKKRIDDTPPGSTDYTWTQSDEEVELTFPIAARIEARKHVKVSFDPSSLKVIVDGMVLADGHTGGLVITDESLFTVQDARKGGKELCITLIKDPTERHEWPYAVSRKN